MARHCKECNNDISHMKHTANFCSGPCRKAFNNRRAMRGAELYDAFMAMRYDRQGAAAEGIDWKFICRMGEAFRDEDRMNGNDQTWRDTREFMDEHAAEVNSRRNVIKCGR